MSAFRGKLATASVALAGLCALAFVLPARAQAPPEKSPATSMDRPVVVELFTSEGCSDCPPAEALALRMEKQPLPGIDMIVLEEHVTYWNQYGWYDPFSSADWTQRQEQYVSKLSKPNPYTPEMVIDGQAQFVGSDAAQAQAAIEAAAHTPATPVSIAQEKLDAKGSGDFKITVGKLEGSTAGNQADVWVAVTQDGLHSAVNAGENAGHTLYHAAVLRYLHKVGAAQATGFDGTAHIKINSKWDRKDVNVVAFVQERKSMKIIGAASTRLGS